MRLLKALSICLLGAAILATTPIAAEAQSTLLPQRKMNVDAQLISEKVAVKPGTTAWLALHMKIRKGWHVYWKNPGDSGEPPVIDWTMPPGFKAGDFRYQPPHRLPVGPLMNYGYSNEAVYLVPVTVPADAKPGETVTLKADTSWLVCEDICVPETKKFTLTLDVMSAEPPVDFRHAEIFEKARAGLPKPSPWKARFARAGDQFVLSVDAKGLKREVIKSAYFYPSSFGVISYAAPQKLSVSKDALTLTTVPSKRAAKGDTVAGVLVIEERLADGGTVSQAFTLTASRDARLTGSGLAGSGQTGSGQAGADQAGGVSIGLLLAIGLALIGGLLLNVMPCVFPILSMKLLGLAQHAHAERRTIAGHGSAYAAGVIGFFALLGVALVALRGAGSEVGWGFHLQEPIVILLLGFLIFAIGLNLSGLFQIGGRLMGVGGGLASKSGYRGSFFTGALAVIVAAPCTVPFMGAAVGYAAFAAWYEAMAVMVALGIGMAAPFVLLCWFPGLLRRLPKPGAWMERLKQVLAFPMYATAAWLLWVATVQAGQIALIAGLAGALLIAFGLWLWQATRNGSGLGRMIAGSTTGLLIAAALGLTVVADQPAAAPKSAEANEGGWRWAAFTPEKLASLRAEGRPVFVNFTAAWCITCIVNERATLRSEILLKAMKARGIAIVKADWTRRDNTIARELAKFGRNGVPLYVFYPPAGSNAKPIVMPQILTENGMMAEIEKFKPIKQEARIAK